eukprot:TRINITY_DN13917_c0_g1_i4.p3 TRINITY_DN13917_c0_g1~~TRINITY_DN13917_c0_g1_i4.p3  ORF type:complete len:249 (+),score=85.52 TRINITY_DN13917_c0_g1_i4:667-1413(+)
MPRLQVLRGSAEGRHGGFSEADRQHYGRCLAGRTIVLIGNSVTRQWMFSLLRLFTSRLVVRLRQKNQCASACGLFLPGPIHVVYLHALYLWGSVADWDKQGKHFGHALLGAPFRLKPDVVVVGLGHQDAFEREDSTPELRRLLCLLRHYASSARVYFRTANPLRRYFSSGYFGDPAFIRRINARLKKTNAAARRLLRSTPVEVLDEEELGEAALRQPEAEQAVYEDHIHAPSVATEMIRRWLAKLCPR